MTKGPSPSPFSAPCAPGVSRSKRLARGVGFARSLSRGVRRLWGLGDQVCGMNLCQLISLTHAAYTTKIIMIASRTLWDYASKKPPSAESSMRNMIASRTLWNYASSKPPSANPLCMRIVLLVESSWTLRSCEPATTKPSLPSESEHHHKQRSTQCPLTHGA